MERQLTVKSDGQSQVVGISGNEGWYGVDVKCDLICSTNLTSVPALCGEKDPFETFRKTKSQSAETIKLDKIRINLHIEPRLFGDPISS